MYSALALGYTCHFASIEIINIIKQNMINSKKGDFSLLAECHILLCGGKGVYSQWSNDVCFSMIKAMGVNGQLMDSGIPVFVDAGFNLVIVEGENTIQLLQIGFYLMKTISKIQVLFINFKYNLIQRHFIYIFLLGWQKYQTF